MAVTTLFSMENEVFRSYAFWCSVLCIKMMFMSVLTGVQRFRTKTFANPEDLPSKKMQVKFDDPNVERVRRAHRNDLENIPAFFIVGFTYLMTNPTPLVALMIYRAFAFARIAHTLVYAVFVIPQPARGIAFFVGMICIVYMAVMSIMHFM